MAKSRPRPHMLISPVNDNRASLCSNEQQQRANQLLKEASIRNMVLLTMTSQPCLHGRPMEVFMFCLFLVFCFFVFLCLCLCWDQIWRLKQDGQLLYHWTTSHLKESRIKQNNKQKLKSVARVLPAASNRNPWGEKSIKEQKKRKERKSLDNFKIEAGIWGPVADGPFWTTFRIH